jgi:hypothetical protein
MKGTIPVRPPRYSTRCGPIWRRSWVPVEFQKSTDYTTVIEAMTTGKVHMAYLSPFSYILATQKQKLVPLVAPGLNGKPFTTGA